MSYPYTKMYSTGGPSSALPSISIATGKLKSIAVPFPHAGRITKLIVKQTSGTSVAFTVDLLTSKIPYPAGSYNTGTSPADDIELYRVLPQQAGSSGVALQAVDDNTGYPYRNMDGDFTKNQRFVYLIITPTSAGTTTGWDVAITGVTPT